MKPFDVSIYLGTDKTIRFIPKLEVLENVAFPLLVGEDCPLSFNYSEIGNTYLNAAKISQSYYGKHLELKPYTQHKVFPKFKTHKEFNNNHYCITTFSIENDRELSPLLKDVNGLGDFNCYVVSECESEVVYAFVPKRIVDRYKASQK